MSHRLHSVESGTSRLAVGRRSASQLPTAEADAVSEAAGEGFAGAGPIAVEKEALEVL